MMSSATITKVFSLVSECDLPAESQLSDRIAEGDFLDCYGVDAEMSAYQAAEIITRFPDWAEFLLKIRTALVTPFGLSTKGPEADHKLGVFPVESETETEVIAGFNDKHLNFRVSVLSLDGRVYLATWVHTHNLAGRLYLKVIMPFHILIARESLVRVAKHNNRI